MSNYLGTNLKGDYVSFVFLGLFFLSTGLIYFLTDVSVKNKIPVLFKTKAHCLARNNVF